MKNLLKLSLLFLLFSVSAFAQDAEIKLQPFVLEVPEVVSLKVRPLGALQQQVDPADSTKKIYSQSVYYELVRADGRAAEVGNKVIPEQFADLLRKYQKGTVTATDLATINAYLQAFNSRMVAKSPQ